MKWSKYYAVACLASASLCSAQTIALTPVMSRALSRTIDLPGEFQPFQSVEIHARVRGYVERVLVDRGSRVAEGQLLVELSAPEMKAQVAEAEARVQSAEAERAQAEAQLAAAQNIVERLRKASETPGAISGNELFQAGKQVEAAEALVRSRRQAGAALAESVKALREVQGYLKITAPFAGVVTERLAHPGALAGQGGEPALLVIQDVSRLRLVVAVPEESVGAIVPGTKVTFRVPASADRAYTGTVARVSHSLDAKTRTMPVELDVVNRDGSLAPGMYATAKWPLRGSQASLLVPKTAVVTTTERTFVVRSRDGRAEWVNVTKGAADGDLLEVRGALKPGDQVVARATDEMREGTPLQAAK